MRHKILPTLLGSLLAISWMGQANGQQASLEPAVPSSANCDARKQATSNYVASLIANNDLSGAKQVLESSVYLLYSCPGGPPSGSADKKSVSDKAVPGAPSGIVSFSKQLVDRVIQEQTATVAVAQLDDTLGSAATSSPVKKPPSKCEDWLQKYKKALDALPEAKRVFEITKPKKEEELQKWREVIASNLQDYKDAQCGPNSGDPIRCLAFLKNIQFARKTVGKLEVDIKSITQAFLVAQNLVNSTKERCKQQGCGCS